MNQVTDFKSGRDLFERIKNVAEQNLKADEKFKKQAQVIYKVQEKRYETEKILTAKSIHFLSQSH